MGRLKKIDRTLLFTLLFLTGMGVVMVYSTSYFLAIKLYGDGNYFFERQILFAGVGLVIMLALASFDFRKLRPFTYPLLAGSFVLLVLVFVPGIGKTVNHAQRWISLGFVAFQPSELAKLALVFYLAHSLAKKEEKIKSFTVGFLPHVMVAGVLLALIQKQPDFGTMMTLSAIVGIMLFISGTRISYLLFSAAAMLPIAFVLITSASYRMKRVLNFIDQLADPRDASFHVTQSFIALGSGGWLGRGLGASRQKLFFLPEAHTDFILAVIGEELGYLGVVAVILAFLIVVWRGLRAAMRTRDNYASYLACGLTIMIGLQAFINIGVVLGCLPTKGLTLPFISWGRTSLLISMAAAGILLSITAEADENSESGRSRAGKSRA
jgi:cell division protein FtsW